MSNKGNNKKKSKLVNQSINRQNQSATGKLGKPQWHDLVQAFLKKWWVESDLTAPNLSLSLRFTGSGCHYNSIYNNTGTKQVK